eukprot:CAMPEP_0171978898 /NCGR_PEP_ID=MMETSP0993-20121228/254399_1 /TAXON_ID=483369 /ORGANISM="non described non described, Strain CCMP2098" /LENGTH=371 /DNA_ID=CAMNT_0012630903 /DNA_START=151 /DNA_END=1267 /DNA_ORIENTATION=-
MARRRGPWLGMIYLVAFATAAASTSLKPHATRKGSPHQNWLRAGGGRCKFYLNLKLSFMCNGYFDPTSVSHANCHVSLVSLNCKTLHQRPFKDGGTTAAKCAASNFKKRDPNYNSLTIVSAKWCGVTGHHSNVSTLGIAKAPRDRSNHESLCVISTKDPTEQLLATISAVEEFYPEFDIVVVDSDSNQTLSVNRTYEAVHRNHENVDVYLARNQNWEYGAWDFAFKGSQTSHTCFMFIQDSLTPTSRIPGFSLKKCKRKIYSFHYASVLADGGYLDRLREVYRHTKLSFISDLADDYEFVGGAHSAFITDRLTSKFMLKLEKAYRDKGLSKTKIDSWLAERTTGIMAAVSGKARVDLTPHFEKKHNGRDFP